MKGDQLELFPGLAGLAARDQMIDELKVKAEKVQDSTGGKKLDQHKATFQGIDPVGLLELGELSAYGARLYGEENWHLVKNGRWRYYNAAFRHLLKSCWEYKDSESQADHFIAAAWCCIAAAWFKRQEFSGNPVDRNPGP